MYLLFWNRFDHDHHECGDFKRAGKKSVVKRPFILCDTVSIFVFTFFVDFDTDCNVICWNEFGTGRRATGRKRRNRINVIGRIPFDMITF